MSKRKKTRAIRTQNNAYRNLPLRGSVGGNRGGYNALSYIRPLTQSPNYANISSSFVFKTKKAKQHAFSSVFGARLPLYTLKQNFTTDKLQKSISSLSPDLVCRRRKERRSVLFAKGKVGGNHKPPTYTLESLVRC